MNTPRLLLVLVALALVLAGGAWYRANRATELGASRDSALQARLDDLEKRLKDETQRADAAEAESATLLKAIDAARSAAVAMPPVPVKPVAPVDAPVPGVTTKAPPGWNKNGNKVEAYAVGVDSNQMWNGQPSAYAKSSEAAADAFGGMMQTTSAEAYLGKRIQLSGWMKTQEANDGGGHLWLRVDGKEQGAVLQFDNMNKRAPTGTTDWQQYSVVLDVPPEARALAYGFFMQGKGQMWVNGAKIDEVGPEVPSTNIMTKPQLPTKPANLNFQSGG